MREHPIAYIRANHPGALPRFRVVPEEITQGGSPDGERVDGARAAPPEDGPPHAGTLRRA